MTHLASAVSAELEFLQRYWNHGGSLSLEAVVFKNLSQMANKALRTSLKQTLGAPLQPRTGGEACEALQARQRELQAEATRLDGRIRELHGLLAEAQPEPEMDLKSFKEALERAPTTPRHSRGSRGREPRQQEKIDGMASLEEALGRCLSRTARVDEFLRSCRRQVAHASGDGGSTQSRFTDQFVQATAPADRPNVALLRMP